MLRKNLKTALVIVILFFIQINVGNAQTKKGKESKESKQFLGEWILKDIIIEPSPNATAEDKAMAEEMKNSIDVFIGKIDMKFEKGGVFSSSTPQSSKRQTGTWRYEKETKRLFVALDGKGEEPQKASINKDGKLELFDEKQQEQTRIKMIMILEKK